MQFIVLTSACFESHFFTAVTCPRLHLINHGAQKSVFTLPEGSLFMQAVSFSRTKQQPNTDFIRVSGDISSDLRQDLWVLFYCLKEWVPPMLHSLRNCWSRHFRGSFAQTMTISGIRSCISHFCHEKVRGGTAEHSHSMFHTFTHGVLLCHSSASADWMLEDSWSPAMCYYCVC